MTTTTTVTAEQIKMIDIVTGLVPTMNRENLILLVEKTNQIGGCSIVSIKNYNSDVSENTELANHLVNIGAAYAPMVEKSKKSFADVTFLEFSAQLKNHSFAGYKTRHSDADILLSFYAAKEELCNPVKRETVSNDVWLNKALVFNTNTLTLCIFGQSLKKEVVVKGEFKVVNSAAKTIAKNIISECVKVETDKSAKTDLLRRFKVSNLTDLKVSGTELEIC